MNLVLGTTLFFAREGATIDGDEVDSATLPDNDPATNWTDNDLGEVENFQPVSTVTTEDIIAASPGRRVRKDVIPISATLDFVFQLKGVSALLWEQWFGTAAITSNFIPNAKTALLKGWLRIVQADQTDSVVSVSHAWVVLQVEGNPTFGAGVVSANMRAKVLYNTLNDGVLTLS